VKAGQEWNEEWDRAGVKIAAGCRAASATSVLWWMTATRPGSELRSRDQERAVAPDMRFEDVVDRIKSEIDRDVGLWVGGGVR
jgi:hypothetical protein